MSRRSKTKRPNDFFKVIFLQLCSNAITIMRGDVSLYIGTCARPCVCVCNLMVACKSHKSWYFIISWAHVRPPTCLRKRPTDILFSIAAPSAAEGVCDTSIILPIIIIVTVRWSRDDDLYRSHNFSSSRTVPIYIYIILYYYIILYIHGIGF